MSGIMFTPAWHIEHGDSPLVAAAIHDGHAIRPAVTEHVTLDETHRRREEDPYTSQWTQVAPTRIVGLRSRFEVDLNRPPEKAVYRAPEDCWGLCVWRGELPGDVIEDSLAIHTAFYQEVRSLLQSLIERHGRVVVYDLHSYNHRRGGPDGPPADPETHPEVNIGTGTMDRDFWAPVVNRFIHDLRAFDFDGRSLNVRENVKFFGGYFPRWIHETFPGRACAIAIEVKKFFMDEWTGEPHEDQITVVGRALQSTVPGVLEEVARL